MHSVVIQPATVGDAAYIAPILREADRCEILAIHADPAATVLAEAVRVSSRAYAAWAWRGPQDFDALALFGVAPVPGHPLLGVPWMVGARGLEDAPKTLVRHSRIWLSRISEGYRRLANWVDARNESSIRWLRWLGFTVHPPLPWGRFDLPFHPFSMEVDRV